MKKLSLSFCLAVMIALGIALNGAPTAAAKGVTFTVSVKSAFLRSAPSRSAPRTDSVFQGQTFTVLGRNADASWLRLNYVGFSAEEWIPAAFGEVQGDLDSLPVMAGAAEATV